MIYNRKPKHLAAADACGLQLAEFIYIEVAKVCARMILAHQHCGMVSHWPLFLKALKVIFVGFLGH